MNKIIISKKLGLVLAEAYLASILLEVAGKACLEAVSAGPQGEPTGRPHFFVRAAWSVK